MSEFLRGHEAASEVLQPMVDKLEAEIASLRKERDRLRKGWARAVVKQWQAGAWKGHRRVVLASRLSEVYDREVSVEEAREIERE